MRLLPKNLVPWRRRAKGHSTVAAVKGFLSPEERKQLAAEKQEQGTLSRAGSRLGSDLKLGPARFRRPK